MVRDHGSDADSLASMSDDDVLSEHQRQHDSGVTGGGRPIRHSAEFTA